MQEARRAPLSLKIALAVSVLLIASSASLAPTSATRHTKDALRAPETLRSRVVRLFDRLDHVSRVIETVRTEMAGVEDRISDLSRQIEARQQLLDRRAAEAFMGGRASGLESLLGASSVTEFGDAVAFLDAVSRSDHDLLVSLLGKRAQLELEQRRLEALEAELREKRRRLGSTASDLVEQLKQQQALLEREVGETADASVGGSGDRTLLVVPPPPEAALGRDAVMSLIRAGFASLGADATQVALCVAEAESGFDPFAVNPSTNAAGVFQFLPSTWETLSSMVGLPAASVFDAGANVAVAAWTVAHYGWHPWRSVADGCGG